MSYRYSIDFDVEVEFGTGADVRKFSDALRAFLRKYQISKYEHTLLGEHTFVTSYTFSRGFDFLEELRKYVDEIRGFLLERGFKKHSYRVVAERVE